jgi:dienelactone hydrolase
MRNLKHNTGHLQIEFKSLNILSQIMKAEFFTNISSAFQTGWRVILFSIFCYTATAQPYPVGTRSQTFTDPARNNRSIGCDVYYPATSAGNNAPLAQGEFPYVVFGHGFLMATAAYEPIASALAAQGMVVFLPGTELGLFPSHTNFGRDLAFVGSEARVLSVNNTNFFFYQALSTKYAVGGHSMGGGCTYLSYAYQSTPAACLFTFAAAETNPSAINEMPGIEIPNLLLAGSLDCVTPPSAHQIPMYEAQTEEACKHLVTITGGYHCQFNNSNFNCTLGENSCSPPGGISRQAQLDLTLSLLIPYLQAWLYPDCDAWQSFVGLMDAPSGYTVSRVCDLLDISNPTITFDGNLERCPEDPVTLIASPGEGLITWNTGQTGPEITPLSSGTYFYTISNGVCEAQSPSVMVTYQDPIIAMVSGDIPEPLCPGSTFDIVADPSIGTVTWFDGSPGYTFTVYESGLYYFTLEAGGCIFQSDTFVVDFPEPIIPEIQFEGIPVLCPGETILLEAFPPQGLINWSTGETGSSIFAQEAGIYYYSQEIEGCLYLSEELEILRPDPGDLKIILSGAEAICDGSPVTLTAQHPGGNTLWSNGAQGATLETNLPGAYSYQLYLENCVFESDTVWLIAINQPTLDISIESNIICPGDSIRLIALYEAGDARWNNGATKDTIWVKSSGNYSFLLDTFGCIYMSDTVEVNGAPILSFGIENDGSTTLCDGQELTLRSFPIAIRHWSTGQIGDSILVSKPGTYTYSTDTLGCTYISDSIDIIVINKPESSWSIESETPLCFGSSEVIFQVSQTEGEIVWMDGDTSRVRKANDTGIFRYEIIAESCIFPGDSTFLEFYAQWLKEPLFIIGESLVDAGETYTYSAAVLDPNLTYAWTVIQGEASIIQGADRKESKVEISTNAREPILLECLLSDTLCLSQKTITKWVQVQSSSISSEKEFSTINIKSLPESWMISGAGSGSGSAAIWHISGKYIREMKLEDGNITVSKQGLPQGFYLLGIKSPDFKKIKYIRLVNN